MISDATTNVNFNLPGFFSTFYKYGLIGLFLSYAFYAGCALFAKGAYRWMAIIILVTSIFSAHTHGTFYMLFYVMMLMDGIVSRFSGKAADSPGDGSGELEEDGSNGDNNE